MSRPECDWAVEPGTATGAEVPQARDGPAATGMGSPGRLGLGLETQLGSSHMALNQPTPTLTPVYVALCEQSPLGSDTRQLSGFRKAVTWSLCFLRATEGVQALGRDRTY